MKRVPAVAFLIALPCLAQSSLEISASGGGLAFGANPVGYQGFNGDNTPANPVTFDNGWLATFRGTLNAGRWFAHEAGFGYGRNTLNMEYNGITTFHQPRTYWLGSYDLLVCATDEEAAVRPCLAGGAHVIGYGSPVNLTVLSRGWDKKAGFNFGGVAKFRVGSRFLVRVDVRDYMNPKPFDLVAKSGWLRQIEFSGGFGLRF